MSLSAAELAGALRSFIRAEGSDALKVLPGILAGVAELPAGPGATPQGAAATGEIACLLFTIMRTLRDVPLRSRVLQALSCLSRFGRCLAMLAQLGHGAEHPAVATVLAKYMKSSGLLDRFQQKVTATSTGGTRQDNGHNAALDR